ncbi:ths1 [Symbiodinium sp. CCMP2456]|nr:ths1 [Symbiodinium sp. CCMP2456]
MAAAAGKRAYAGGGPRIGEKGKFEGEFKVQKQAPYIKHRLDVWEKLYKKYTDGLASKPQKKIEIELPDGTKKNGEAFKTSPMEIAMSISKGLAESAVVAKVIYKESVESLKQCVVADVEEDEPEEQADAEQSVLWDMTRLARVKGARCPEPFTSIPLHLCLSRRWRIWRPSVLEDFFPDVEKHQKETSRCHIFISTDDHINDSESIVRKQWCCQILLNARAAAVATACVSFTVGILQVHGSVPCSIWTAVISHLTSLLVLFFWQYIRAWIGLPQLTFLRELCVPRKSELRPAELQKLRGILKRSQTLVVICSASYFRCPLCVYEVVSFLAQSRGEGNVLAMPESMGWLFFLFYLSCQCLVFGLYAFSGVRDASSMTSLSVACVLGGVGVAVAFGQLRHLFSLAMQMQTLAQLATVQIRRFSVEKASCECCHLRHVHPITGSTLPCDFIEVCSLIEEASRGDGLQLFNMRVREQAATLLRLSSCRVSAPMLELLSTCVLPTLPRYMLLWSLGPAETLAMGELVVWYLLLLLRWASLFLVVLFALCMLLALARVGQAVSHRVPPALLQCLLCSTYIVAVAVTWVAMRLCFVEERLGTLLPICMFHILLFVDICLSFPCFALPESDNDDSDSSAFAL